MKDTIRSAFDAISMPKDCENHILAAMHETKKQAKIRPNFTRIAAAAACLVAMILLLFNPTVVEALEKVLSPGLQKDVTQNGQDLTITYSSADGKFQSSTTVKGKIELAGHGRNNLLVSPEWYVEKEDRVYFAGNCEWIDVTDKIDLETPFTYIYTDQGGVIHYICIGGVYDPDPEVSNVGYAEWFYDPNYVNTNGTEGRWVGGYCDNYWDKETDDDWPWLKKAKKEMGIPWG